MLKLAFTSVNWGCGAFSCQTQSGDGETFGVFYDADSFLIQLSNKQRDGLREESLGRSGGDGMAEPVLLAVGKELPSFKWHCMFPLTGYGLPGSA